MYVERCYQMIIVTSKNQYSFRLFCHPHRACHNWAFITETLLKKKILWINKFLLLFRIKISIFYTAQQTAQRKWQTQKNARKREIVINVKKIHTHYTVKVRNDHKVKFFHCIKHSATAQTHTQQACIEMWKCNATIMIMCPLISS